MLRLSYCNKKKIIKTGLFFGIIVFDQTTKWIAQKYLSGEIFFIIPNFFSFKLYQNYSTIFGIYLNPVLFFIFFIFFILVIYQKNSNFFSKIPKLYFALVAGGAISNIIDRIRFGYIIDFVSFNCFQSEAIFNLADCAIIIGVALIVWNILIKEKVNLY